MRAIRVTPSTSERLPDQESDTNRSRAQHHNKMSLLLRFFKVYGNCDTTRKSTVDQARNQTGGNSPPESFKLLHSNFDVWRNFQIIKLKFCILIIFKKSFTSIFLCLYWLIVPLQDISWDRPSDRKFRKWLVAYLTTNMLKLGDRLKQWFSKWLISNPRGQLDYPRGR